MGREQELALLLDRWERAKEGEGEVVLLSGEAGIGKSPLVRAFREHLSDEPHTPLGQFCSPHHTNTALHPVVGLLERAAALHREDPPESQLAKLEAMLALAVGDAPGEAAALLAELLDIPAGGRYPPLALSPQQRKDGPSGRSSTSSRGLLPTGFGAVPGEYLRLGFGHLGELLLQHCPDPGVELLAPAPEQAVVGRVLHQRMLKAVGRLRRRAPGKDQLCRRQLSQGTVELGRG